jgi:uncharacterized protein YgiM (DUF1202 family)
MFATTFKKIALAAAIVAVTASTSMAATWAWVDQDSNVKKFHKNSAMNINYVHEGQKVKVVDQWNNWFKIQIPGKDGWVKANKLDFHPGGNNGWGNNGWGNNGWGNSGWGPGFGGSVGGSFCVNGQHAQFCLGAYN